MIQAWKNSIRLRQAKDRTIQKYLETSSNIRYIGAIWSSLRREDCNFIKQDHTQSFSTTHYLRFVLRKRYAWRLRRSYTVKFNNLHGCLELYWSRIRKVDNKINMIKKQENPQTTKAHRREVTVKPVAATLTLSYQAYLSPTTRHESRRNGQKSWFNSWRITRTRSLSCRTWIRRRRLVSSAKSRRNWSTTWATPRSSNFAKPLPRNNGPKL